MDNEILIERLKQLEHAMVKRKDAEVEAFKEKQKRELTGYETKKVWEANGYSQALVDVRDLLKEEESDELQI